MRNDVQKSPEEIPPKGIKIWEIWERCGDKASRIGICGEEGLDLVKQVLKESPGLLHGNARRVQVTAVDDAQLQPWLRPGGAGPVFQDQVFESAAAASRHLGYQYNEIGQRLAHERAKAEARAAKRYGEGHRVRIRPEIKIRGVTLQYEDDVKDI